MTDPTSLPDDELVSAVLDGEATADERARVAADPVLSARLERFDEVRRRVAAPVAVPAAGREAPARPGPLRGARAGGGAAGARPRRGAQGAGGRGAARAPPRRGVGAPRPPPGGDPPAGPPLRGGAGRRRAPPPPGPPSP